MSVKRLFDGLLILLVVGTVALGAYAIGKRVDHESNKLSSQDSELNSSTATVASASTHGAKSNETPIIVAVSLGGAVALLILGSAVGAVSRSRKRERWRAS